MGRPRQERTVQVRLKKSLLSGLRNEFPNLGTDGDRVANCYDYYKKVQGTIDGVGGFIYGKAWKKNVKK